MVLVCYTVRAQVEVDEERRRRKVLRPPRLPRMGNSLEYFNIGSFQCIKGEARSAAEGCNLNFRLPPPPPYFYFTGVRGSKGKGRKFILSHRRVDRIWRFAIGILFYFGLSERRGKSVCSKISQVYPLYASTVPEIHWEIIIIYAITFSLHYYFIANLLQFFFVQVQT